MDQTTSLLQTALTPAFLLVALGSLLPVFSGRLARIVDRSRALMNEYRTTEGEEHQIIVNELRDLEKRMTTVNIAIGLNVLSAIVVSFLIGMLFLMGMTHLNLGSSASCAFFLAILLLAGSLVTFMMEVHMAIKSVRIREEFLERPLDPKQSKR